MPTSCRTWVHCSSADDSRRAGWWSVRVVRAGWSVNVVRAGWSGQDGPGRMVVRQSGPGRMVCQSGPGRMVRAGWSGQDGGPSEWSVRVVRQSGPGRMVVRQSGPSEWSDIVVRQSGPGRMVRNQALLLIVGERKILGEVDTLCGDVIWSTSCVMTSSDRHPVR
ncbi:hypothetical protein ACOMHN_028397 [Nucella lapillus]